jgi:hypothetical protein
MSSSQIWLKSVVFKLVTNRSTMVRSLGFKQKSGTQLGAWTGLGSTRRSVVATIDLSSFNLPLRFSYAATEAGQPQVAIDCDFTGE